MPSSHCTTANDRRKPSRWNSVMPHIAFRICIITGLSVTNEQTWATDGEYNPGLDSWVSHVGYKFYNLIIHSNQLINYLITSPNIPIVSSWCLGKVYLTHAPPLSDEPVDCELFEGFELVPDTWDRVSWSHLSMDESRFMSSVCSVGTTPFSALSASTHQMWITRIVQTSSLNGSIMQIIKTNYTF